MKIYDISRELLSAEVYPGDPAPEIEKREADGFTTSSVKMCLHNATHVDAPAHIGEKVGVDALPVEKCLGRCTVFTPEGKFGLGQIVRLKRRGVRKLLLRGAITPLVSMELALANFDLIGVETNSVGGKFIHGNLLRSGAVILEGLDLGGVADGDYILIALPLKIAGADGSPVRAILIDTNGVSAASGDGK